MQYDRSPRTANMDEKNREIQGAHGRIAMDWETMGEYIAKNVGSSG